MSSSITVPRVTRAALTREVGIKTELTSDYPVKQAADLEPGECIIKIECTGFVLFWRNKLQILICRLIQRLP